MHPKVNMATISADLLDLLWHDADLREERLREIVEDRLAERPPPVIDDQIVASYFFALRSTRLKDAVASIAYHATSGTKNPPPGSLLAECTATAVGVDTFDATGRLGLLHVAFPLKMLLQSDGHLTSCDLLHTAANAIIFDVYENLDARLVWLQIPEQVLKTFPGPAYGPQGVRHRTGFPDNEPAFGTILKPTAGITPDTVAELVEQAATCPLFLFIKEDENLYPNLDYSPVVERTRRAIDRIRYVKEETGGHDILFAPHITGAPHELTETIDAVVEAGATAVMFSETFAGGAVRLVREATRHLDQPPAIYGHNAGIGVKTRSIWREVIDFLARLDGIDFRQTAPVGAEIPFIKPYGREWEASERVLASPIEGIKPTMIVRAGGLDQGNIGSNLADAERRGISDGVLFLAGSAINSIKNDRGVADPRLGAQAMVEALDVHRSGAIGEVSAGEYVDALKSHAVAQGYDALTAALTQRYPTA
ncbi:RuBisCO large subunit C-terminal-like domain-containing protein [Pirellulales bacterium]|nr:RuBisCO large subunit C-terminal-like domain-containing protein [Pirellulales bacterium]